MTNQNEFLPSRQVPSRQVVCSRCGTEFTCALSGACWCTEETVRLPMPTDGEDCLCRDCLHKPAGALARSSPDCS
ncbi:MAG: hypothetical protein HY852_11145 [Bradyrhizobium sp.]|uniref:cysteine-rich CWC family protein n=1 Tax=Bradyrhizobium sp. TaxID=376 RepID=UPI0025BDEB57|nr:cysteine-rich CWC family protein [Bradyrhizobium sp.]MBI5262357.1 hypothetical protein [Bradyrhizobium sp.]